VRNTIPDLAKEGLKSFDFVFVATKDIANVHSTVSEIIGPAVTPGHTTIALIQNGLNIEKPLIAAFPTNTILSGVALIGATDTQPGSIFHDEHDHLILGRSTTQTSHVIFNWLPQRSLQRSTMLPAKSSAS
jgi:ketopantoate reductase